MLPHDMALVPEHAGTHVGVQTLKDAHTFALAILNAHSLPLCNSSWGIQPQKNLRVDTRCMYKDVSGSIISNSKKLETTGMSITGEMAK